MTILSGHGALPVNKFKIPYDPNVRLGDTLQVYNKPFHAMQVTGETIVAEMLDRALADTEPNTVTLNRFSQDISVLPDGACFMEMPDGALLWGEPDIIKAQEVVS